MILVCVCRFETSERSRRLIEDQIAAVRIADAELPFAIERLVGVLFLPRAPGVGMFRLEVWITLTHTCRRVGSTLHANRRPPSGTRHSSANVRRRSLGRATHVSGSGDDREQVPQFVVDVGGVLQGFGDCRAQRRAKLLSQPVHRHTESSFTHA